MFVCSDCQCVNLSAWYGSATTVCLSTTHFNAVPYSEVHGVDVENHILSLSN